MFRESTLYLHIQIRQKKMCIITRTHRGLEQQVKFNPVLPILLVNLGGFQMPEL